MEKDTTKSVIGVISNQWEATLRIVRNEYGDTVIDRPAAAGWMVGVLGIL